MGSPRLAPFIAFNNTDIYIHFANPLDVKTKIVFVMYFRHQLLPDDDLGPLYDLLIDDPADIRRAIGELVYDHLIAQKFNSSQSGIRGFILFL